MCHMQIAEAIKLADVLGIDRSSRSGYKLPAWDRFVIFIITATQGETLRDIESKVHLSKSALQKNTQLFTEHVVAKLNTQSMRK